MHPMYIEESDLKFLMSLLNGTRTVTPYEHSLRVKLIESGLVESAPAKTHLTLGKRLEIVDSYSVKITEQGKEEAVK